MLNNWTGRELQVVPRRLREADRHCDVTGVKLVVVVADVSLSSFELGLHCCLFAVVRARRPEPDRTGAGRGRKTFMEAWSCTRPGLGRCVWAPTLSE